VRKEIWAVIRTIKETGIASIIIDKEIKALLRVAERNFIISKGSIVYQGSSEELAAQPDIHKRYMGV
jgi:branched-chain amino acid transport system ATP-binding protein